MLFTAVVVDNGVVVFIIVRVDVLDCVVVVSVSTEYVYDVTAIVIDVGCCVVDSVTISSIIVIVSVYVAYAVGYVDVASNDIIIVLYCDVVVYDTSVCCVSYVC